MFERILGVFVTAAAVAAALLATPGLGTDYWSVNGVDSTVTRSA